jgi:hypothetical protein
MSNRSMHLPLGAILLTFFALLWSASSQAADPIKIGFSASLTGGLASTTTTINPARPKFPAYTQNFSTSTKSIS